MLHTGHIHRGVHVLGGAVLIGGGHLDVLHVILGGGEHQEALGQLGGLVTTAEVHDLEVLVDGGTALSGDGAIAVDVTPTIEVGTAVQILLLTDATQDYYYANFGQSAGTITIDLGGHKLIQNNNNACFWTQAKYVNSTMHDITLNVLNGEVVIQNNLLRFDANAGYQTGFTNNNGEYKTFHISFDDVVFSFKEGATSTSFLASCGSNASKVTAYVGYDIIFNN